MSFYTSLTGLKAATTELALTSNNIANVGTSGFKKSRASFGDIFATSPLQKSTSVVGQGVSLKEVRQEFSQGNVEFSSNTLDLAISGEGFFPLKSADGLTDIYTRNGSFVLNEQFNVVNSSGQALLAAAVDSSGKADLDKLSRLAIPVSTSGQALETSLIELSLNLPSDANIIGGEFNRNNPDTYNKSTALSVYDSGGNSYLATIYYVKTSNATANSPTNKWQTYVFVGDDEVYPALQQARDANSEELYVNKYGVLKPRSEVEDLLVNRKTKYFALDDLTDQRTSVPATVTSGNKIPEDMSSDQGFNFVTLATTAGDGGRFDTAAGGGADATNRIAAFTNNLATFARIDIDNTGNPVTLDLTAAAGMENRKYTGVELAKFMQDQLNVKFGDERYFDISSSATLRQFQINYTPSGGAATGFKAIDLTANANLNSAAKQSSATVSTMVAAMQAQINASAIGANKITVGYDYAQREFKFTPANSGDVIAIKAGAAGSNALFGLTTTEAIIDPDGFYGQTVTPNGALQRIASEQRYGIKVEYDGAAEKFSFSSGTTGDTSEISIDFNTNPAGVTVQNYFAEFLGFEVNDTVGGTDSKFEVAQSDEALRGVVSLPAITRGSSIAVNVNNTFSVDASNDTFVVSVDDVKGTLKIPQSGNYTLDSFILALEKGINQLASTSGSSVSGVTVAYDAEANGLVITTGTTGTDSFIKVSGSATWGLANIEAGRGTTTTFIKPTQFAEVVNNVAVNKYIDEFGNETASADGYTTLPEWSPIYLDKGELTFDTSGNLQSPTGGAQLDTVFLAGGRGALNLTIDYGNTTQFSQAFAVKSQNQDGSPEGDLVGVDIGDDGLVVASYSNGAQDSLGKIVLTTFPSNEGLRQNGDSSYLSSAKSGAASFGEAGTAGYGTIRAGARERSNVDLTTELVGLITAQRNFQANAKAIETSGALTSAIINIRS